MRERDFIPDSLVLGLGEIIRKADAIKYVGNCEYKSKNIFKNTLTFRI